MGKRRGRDKALRELCDALLQIKTVEECRYFLYDLLSEKEIVILSKRWAIVQDLNKGASQRAAAKKFKAGAFTATRCNKALRNGKGFRLVLSRQQ